MKKLSCFLTWDTWDCEINHVTPLALIISLVLNSEPNFMTCVRIRGPCMHLQSHPQQESVPALPQFFKPEAFYMFSCCCMNISLLLSHV